MQYLDVLLGLYLLQFFATMYLIGYMACMVYSNKDRIEKLEKNN